MEVEQEVYCKDCEFYKSNSRYCNYVKDIRVTKTPKEKKEKEVYAQPKKDNKNNDCDFYKERNSVLEVVFGNDYGENYNPDVSGLIKVYEILRVVLVSIYRFLFVPKDESS